MPRALAHRVHFSIGMALEGTEQNETTPAHPRDRAIGIRRAAKWLLVCLGVLMLSGIVAIAIPYRRLSRIVDRQLAAGPFQHTYSFYAAPITIAVGDREAPADLIAALRRGGFHESTRNDPQSFTVLDNTVVVQGASPARIDFAPNLVRGITDLGSDKKLQQLDLPPQLITNLSDEGRAKRIIDTLFRSAARSRAGDRVGGRQALLQTLRPGCAAHRQGALCRREGAPQRAGRLDYYDAAREKSLARSRQALEAENRRVAYNAASGTQTEQAADSGILLQPGLSRRRRDVQHQRIRRGRARLL